ncbi:phosphonate ABC transporter, periplasmic phosphonate-binding protein [[Leptolyngbya] sp. PCC 7376]|uniref:putative selenate ABC transporter substrate-binding protein n=1 Tax=[Leptolyngbya] sp. PCC 7376 TaxID=111781 RepID=UPI00029EE3AE|nr:putative selenate ABC transporter substrate-binding protein [[Leptolyngbya] sp. PCC 7376]AFY39066.1 phosphonate ABC transporter, periplasmic phosphonate-binding protein [[Leptolyngbya] sp. PCC 7376]
MKNLLRSTCCLLAISLFSCTTLQPPAQDTDATQSTADTETTAVEPLIAGAIPDQDPEKLQRLYGLLADYLSETLEVPVEYKPVTDYRAAVTAFKVGDLDLVWFGGLTGVQARLQVDGAQAIAQRNIDTEFHSVLIANVNSGLDGLASAEELTQLKGKTLTFGSESSTSGRLMPQYFLEQAGVNLEDFQGEVGFSGSHDVTIQLVEAGTYDVGMLSEEVWESRLEAGEFDTNKVKEIWRTPAYFNYHWVISPAVDERYGEGFSEKVQAALFALDPKNPDHAEILDLFSAESFIPTTNENYIGIETVGRKIGKVQ